MGMIRDEALTVKIPCNLIVKITLSDANIGCTRYIEIKCYSFKSVKYKTFEIMALLSKRPISKFWNIIKYMERAELSEREHLQSMVLMKHVTIATKNSKNTELNLHSKL